MAAIAALPHYRIATFGTFATFGSIFCFPECKIPLPLQSFHEKPWGMVTPGIDSDRLLPVQFLNVKKSKT